MAAILQLENNGGLNPVPANVTLSRALGTVYQNTSLRSIFVTATFRTVTTNNNGVATIQGFSDASVTPTTAVTGALGVNANTNKADISITISFFVLPSKYYKIVSTTSSGSNTLLTWVEVTF